MSEQTEDGGPAFAYEHKEWDSDDREWRTHFIHPGMSLRDYFAAKALPAFLRGFDDPASRRLIKDSGQDLHELAAKAAYMQADIMLKARQS